jgi:hypothetical protein
VSKGFPYIKLAMVNLSYSLLASLLFVVYVSGIYQVFQALFSQMFQLHQYQIQRLKHLVLPIFTSLAGYALIVTLIFSLVLYLILLVQFRTYRHKLSVVEKYWRYSVINALFGVIALALVMFGVMNAFVYSSQLWEIRIHLLFASVPGTLLTNICFYFWRKNTLKYESGTGDDSKS